MHGVLAALAAAEEIDPATVRPRRTMNTKKLPKAIHSTRTNPSRTKIPAFIPFASGESDLPKQAEQALAPVVVSQSRVGNQKESRAFTFQR